MQLCFSGEKGKISYEYCSHVGIQLRHLKAVTMLSVRVAVTFVGHAWRNLGGAISAIAIYLGFDIPKPYSISSFILSFFQLLLN
jgi:hypothetical protein